MIYGISLVLGILGVVLLYPAARKLLFMRDVRRNSGSTPGTVSSTKSATGWLWAAAFGNQDRPLVHYVTPRGTEMVLEINSSNFLPQRNYEPGQMIEVLYDKESPGRAFAAREWPAALRDFLLGTGVLLFAIFLWVAGRIYNLPF